MGKSAHAIRKLEQARDEIQDRVNDGDLTLTQARPLIDTINGVIVELLFGSTPRAAGTAAVVRSPGLVPTEAALPPIATEATITLTSTIDRAALKKDSLDSVFQTWESPARRRDTLSTRLVLPQPIAVKQSTAKRGDETQSDVFDHRLLKASPDDLDADWNEAVDQVLLDRV